ncbi:MAG: chemotaxis protein CheW, partial [Methanomicrobiales archaeon]
ALDIQFTREIVEALPITVIPRSPEYIAGMTNIRGEITTLISIDRIIGVTAGADPSQQEFIIFVPERTRGDNLGIIVDEVNSVMEISDQDVESLGDGDSTRDSFITGIIRVSENGEEAKDGSEDTRLVMYLDIERLIDHLYEASQ